MLFEELIEVIDPQPHGAALNMAIDEVLLRGATAPLLRVYRWARPAVSFGYFGKYGAVAAEWPQRELVRRWTGGGVVPHGDDVTYTLIVPRSCRFFELDLLESYRSIHKVIASIFSEARVLEFASTKVSEACFENPVQHDVLIGRKKIAGAAQRRTRFGLLHQGSILVSEPATIRAQLASGFAKRVVPRELQDQELGEAELLGEKYAADAWLRRW